jgi:hypothetical protein
MPSGPLLPQVQTHSLSSVLNRPLGHRAVLRLFTRADVAVLGVTLFVYAFVRFVGLERFPIFFFCDEAVETNLASDLLHHHLHDAAGLFLPPYFRNVSKWNLSLSVYVHAAATLLFGKSVFVNRATSAAVTLLAAMAVAVTLRLIVKIRFWWAGPLVLSTLPVWFLHSRTSFETAMMVAFYACFVCTYLLYRYLDPRWAIAAILFGGATFYSYANGQGVMLVSGVLLLVSDLPYHRRTFRSHPRLLWIAAATLGLVAFQYLRFRMLHPDAVAEHLRGMDSIWTRDVALTEKLATFARNYWQGLSPDFWFLPDNGVDLDRHTMKGWGNLPLVLLPFLLVGLAICARRGQSAAHRAVLIGILAAPFSASLVLIHNYRVLTMVVPATILICLGIDAVAAWLMRCRVPKTALVAGCAVALLGMNAALVRAALVDGPTWYTNYGLYGMQYGAAQIFSTIRADLEHAPQASFIVSPDWANNPDAFAPFFLDDHQVERVRFLSPRDYVTRKRDWQPDTIFVLPADQYAQISATGKFAVETPLRVLRYPDGHDGFFFVRLRYVRDIDAILAAERQARARLVEDTAMLDGQAVHISHSITDAGTVADLFDEDKRTLLRGFEANPMVLDLSFPEPRQLHSIGLDIYPVDLGLTVTLWSDQGEQPQMFRSEYRGLPQDAHVEVAIPNPPASVRRVRLELLDLTDTEVTKIHIETLRLR